MSLKSGDRVKETTTIEGTGTATLLGAAVGFQTFSSVLSDSDTCYYCIELGSEWEVGTGTYSAGTLARTTVQSSSNANALVDFSAGTKSVFLTFPALAAQNLAIQPLTGILYVDQNSPAVSPDGSIAAPFTTIGAALSAIGNATTAAEQEEGWRIFVAAGFYPEFLSIPDLRRITIDCAPQVFLTDSATFTAYGISSTQTRASLSPLNFASLTINNLFSFGDILCGQFAAGNVDLDVTLNNCTFHVAAPSDSVINATAWTTQRLRLKLNQTILRGSSTYSIHGGGGGDIGISYARECSFAQPVSVGSYGQFSLCLIENDLEFTEPAGATSADELTAPFGFYQCNFPAATQFTGTQPGDFKVDDVTWKSAQASVTINAPATVENLSNAYYSANGADWSGSAPDNVSDAIDRLAAFVAATHGAIP